MKTCLNCGEIIEDPDAHECPSCGSEDLEETSYYDEEER
jgi:rRNA maturation endonuclease Nob1